MLTQLLVWLNALAGAMGTAILSPIAWLPGWLSATLIAALTGVAMLLVFKHTSHQAAIRRTRNQIKANLLALSLFKDSLPVSLRAQGRILASAGRLLLLSIIPLLVMTLPMVLLLGQLSLWYQAQPLPVGADSIVTLRLSAGAEENIQHAALMPSSAFDCTVGPVRVPAESIVCWKIQTRQTGLHQLSLNVAGETYTKELAVGTGFLPVSLKRPEWNWTEVLLHPRERPFAVDSPVQMIEVVYPERQSMTAGTDSWLVYWFAASMIAAFVARPFLKVNL